MDECNWIEAKGKGKATYYNPGHAFPQKTPASKDTAPIQKTPAPEIMRKIEAFGKKVQDLGSIKDIIIEICKRDSYSASELAHIFRRKEKYFKRQYLAP